MRPPYAVRPPYVLEWPKARAQGGSRRSRRSCRRAGLGGGQTIVGMLARDCARLCTAVLGPHEDYPAGITRVGRGRAAARPPRLKRAAVAEGRGRGRARRREEQQAKDTGAGGREPVRQTLAQDKGERREPDIGAGQRAMARPNLIQETRTGTAGYRGDAPGRRPGGPGGGDEGGGGVRGLADPVLRGSRAGSGGIGSGGIGSPDAGSAIRGVAGTAVAGT